MTYLYVVLTTFACQGNVYFNLADTYSTKEEATEHYTDLYVFREAGNTSRRYDPETNKDYEDCMIVGIKTGHRSQAKQDEIEKHEQAIRDKTSEVAEEPKEEPIVELSINDVGIVTNGERQALEEAGVINGQ